MRVSFELVEFEYGAGAARGLEPVVGGTSLRELIGRFETRHGWTPAAGYGPLLLDPGGAADHFRARATGRTGSMWNPPGSQ